MERVYSIQPVPTEKIGKKLRTNESKSLIIIFFRYISAAGYYLITLVRLGNPIYYTG